MHYSMHTMHGLLMARTEEEMCRMIHTWIDLSDDTPLTINKQKTTTIIFNHKQQPHQIKSIKVSQKIQYLGVTVTNRKNCLKNQKEKSIQKAKKLANLTYPVIAQSCNKILIGKTFWKSIVLPTVLYASSILAYTN